MFKLVVLFALVAAAVAKPGAYLGVAPLAYSAPVISHAVPTAVSSQSRYDIHRNGVIATTYTAPAVVGTETSYVAPVAAYTAPVAATYNSVAAYGALPYAGYSAGVYGHGYGYASPYGYY